MAYLLPINDVPDLGFCVTVANIAGFVPSITVKGLRIGFWILEITFDDRGSTEADLALSVVGRYILTVVIDDSDLRVNMNLSFTSFGLEAGKRTYFASRFGISLPTPPVVSCSG